MAGRKAKKVDGQLIEAPAKRPPGRPSTYDPRIITRICERLSKGEFLAVICRDPDMPGLSTVYDWANADPDVSGRIARAREEGEEQIAIGALASLDEPPAMTDTQFGAKVDAGDVALRKLRFEGKLKMLAVFNPKKWGERRHVEHSGAISLESIVAGDGDDQ